MIGMPDHFSENLENHIISSVALCPLWSVPNIHTVRTANTIHNVLYLITLLEFHGADALDEGPPDDPDAGPLLIRRHLVSRVFPSVPCLASDSVFSCSLFLSLAAYFLVVSSDAVAADPVFIGQCTTTPPKGLDYLSFLNIYSDIKQLQKITQTAHLIVFCLKV